MTTRREDRYRHRSHENGRHGGGNSPRQRRRAPFRPTRRRGKRRTSRSGRHQVRGQRACFTEYVRRGFRGKALLVKERRVVFPCPFVCVLRVGGHVVSRQASDGHRPSRARNVGDRSRVVRYRCKGWRKGERNGRQGRHYASVRRRRRRGGGGGRATFRRAILRVVGETIGGTTLARCINQGIRVDERILLRIYRGHIWLFHRISHANIQLFHSHGRRNEFHPFKDDSGLQAFTTGLRYYSVFRWGKRVSSGLSGSLSSLLNVHDEGGAPSSMFIVVFVGSAAVNVPIRITNGNRGFARTCAMILRTNKVGRCLMLLSVTASRNGLYRSSHQRWSQASNPINGHARIRLNYENSS